jgi:uncharacterized membrane protein YiaA
VKNIFRVLCALAVFVGSTANSVAFYHAVGHHRLTPGYVIAVLIFAGLGVLSFASIYFILDLA